MTCMCNPNVHRATALTTAGVLTVTNSTNVANLDPFVLILCVNPNNIITGAPVDYTLNVNGVDIALKNRLGLPISTDRLSMRRAYHGYYVVPATGGPYVILLDTPCNVAYALSSASTAAASTDDNGGS